MQTITNKLEPFLERIYKKNIFQKKMIQKFQSSQDETYWNRANEFADKFIPFLKKKGIDMDYVVDSYLKMCADMVQEQIYFKKTGQYSAKNAAEANKKVYSDEKNMSYYMYGVAMSQFLWPNHYGLFDAFLAASQPFAGKKKNYLEIGSGHGLFFVESLKMFSGANLTAVDISPISLGITKDIVAHFKPEAKANYILEDVNNVSGVIGNQKFDYIVMCEVLEHVDDPMQIMRSIHRLLTDDGHFFMTTCANAPAIDHVYLYNDVEHIQKEIDETGFQIMSERAMPVGNFPRAVWSKEKVEVNYASLLKKK